MKSKEKKIISLLGRSIVIGSSYKIQNLLELIYSALSFDAGASHQDKLLRICMITVLTRGD